MLALASGNQVCSYAADLSQKTLHICTHKYTPMLTCTHACTSTLARASTQHSAHIQPRVFCKTAEQRSLRGAP